MLGRARSPAFDVNQLAGQIVEQATGGDVADIVAKAQAEGKNPAAVLLGLRGASKGGKARAKSLSAKRRSEIAKKAARARWADG